MENEYWEESHHEGSSFCRHLKQKERTAEQREIDKIELMDKNLINRKFIRIWFITHSYLPLDLVRNANPFRSVNITIKCSDRHMDPLGSLMNWSYYQPNKLIMSVLRRWSPLFLHTDQLMTSTYYNLNLGKSTQFFGCQWTTHWWARDLQHDARLHRLTVYIPFIDYEDNFSDKISESQ